MSLTFNIVPNKFNVKASDIHIEYKHDQYNYSKIVMIDYGDIRLWNDMIDSIENNTPFHYFRNRNTEDNYFSINIRDNNVTVRHEIHPFPKSYTDSVYSSSHSIFNFSCDSFLSIATNIRNELALLL